MSAAEAGAGGRVSAAVAAVDAAAVAAAFRHQPQAGHRPARAARQWSRALSLPLQGRRSHDLCGRHGAGRAEDRPERSLARSRRIFAGRLRPDRGEIHDVERVARTRRCESLLLRREQSWCRHVETSKPRSLFAPRFCAGACRRLLKSDSRRRKLLSMLWWTRRRPAIGRRSSRCSGPGRPRDRELGRPRRG